MRYDTVTYEGYGPHMVPVVVECLTDNRNRTASNIRVIFDKHGGQLAQSGAVTWDFDRLGCIEATHEGEVDPETEAIEAGAQDLEAEEDDDGNPAGTSFYTDPTDLDAVRRALEERGWTVSSAALIYKSKNPLPLEGDEERAAVEAFFEALDEDDDVQNLFVGLA